MAFIADYPEPFSTSPRYHRITEYHVDREKGEVNVKMVVFKNATTRSNQIEALSEIYNLQDQMKATAIEARDDVRKSRTDVEYLERMRNRKGLNDQRSERMNELQQVVSANAASAERIVKLTGLNVDSITLSDVYKATQAILNGETS